MNRPNRAAATGDGLSVPRGTGHLHGAPIDDLVLAYLDVETTGLSPYRGDRVCEVAILLCRGEEVLDAYQQLVDPQRTMPPEAFAVHHISDLELRGQPTFAAVADRVLALFARADALLGHNLPFDLGFMQAELDRLGLALPAVVGLDTMRLARATYTTRRAGLAYLVGALDLDVAPQAHRAMADVALTRTLFLRILEDLSGVTDESLTLGELLAWQGGPVESPQRRQVQELPPVIARALADGVLLRIKYCAASCEVTDRMVTPVGVSGSGPSLALMAHCHLRESLRAFRLDRILEIDLVQEGTE
jgi:DNA polymerase III subunit epsilon